MNGFDAIETIIMAPFAAIVVGIFVYIPFKVCSILRPGTTGMWGSTMDRIDSKYHTAISLLNIVSDLQLLISMAVLFAILLGISKSGEKY